SAAPAPLALSRQSPGPRPQPVPREAALRAPRPRLPRRHRARGAGQRRHVVPRAVGPPRPPLPRRALGRLLSLENRGSYQSLDHVPAPRAARPRGVALHRGVGVRPRGERGLPRPRAPLPGPPHRLGRLPRDARSRLGPHAGGVADDRRPLFVHAVSRLGRPRGGGLPPRVAAGGGGARRGPRGGGAWGGGGGVDGAPPRGVPP